MRDRDVGFIYGTRHLLVAMVNDTSEALEQKEMLRKKVAPVAGIRSHTAERDLRNPFWQLLGHLLRGTLVDQLQIRVRFALCLAIA